jgi:hypothetical protein
VADTSPWSFSLTREDILARKAKRDRIADELERLQQQLESEDKWFEAISLILPPAFLATLPGVSSASEPTDTRSVWRRAVESVVAAATRGLLPREVAQGIREGGDAEAKERLTRNPNGVYSAIERLIEDGSAIRYRDKIYSKSVFEILKANGELDDDAEEGGLVGANLYIVNGLKTFGPMIPKQIIDLMKEDETFAAKIAGNPQYGYSTIARLVRKGHIQKDADGRYRLSSKENEPSDVSPSNGSDAGSDDDGRPRALRLV